jgi:hypothetical protein
MTFIQSKQALMSLSCNLKIPFLGIHLHTHEYTCACPSMAIVTLWGWDGVPRLLMQKAFIRLFLKIV